MPRQLPGLAQEFSDRVNDALLLAEAGEVARVDAPSPSRTRSLFHFTRLESLHELAFLKVFVSWEFFLEQTFYRLLCGYTSAQGQEPLKPGVRYMSSLSAAELAVLGTWPFAPWHNPTKVITRAQRFFLNGNYETVIASNRSRIEAMANIRHRIVHSQRDALNKCHLATMMFSGVRYRGARAGRFLRDGVQGSQPRVNWLTTLSTELRGLAQQLS
jgi:hypothetical protein